MADFLNFIGTAALALSTTLLAGSCEPPAAGAASGERTEKVTIGDRTFTLRLAIDDDARERGLSGVKEIPEEGGMLFIFRDSELRSFWMKDCVIDLDIAFLDPFGIVTAVHTMPKEPPRGERESESAYHARLKRYTSGVPAQFAIEVRPGLFAELGVKRGTRIPLDLAKLKAAAK